jgi:hypothetical protein
MNPKYIWKFFWYANFAIWIIYWWFCEKFNKGIHPESTYPKKIYFSTI